MGETQGQTPEDELRAMARRLHELAATTQDPIALAQLNAAAGAIETMLTIG